MTEWKKNGIISFVTNNSFINKRAYDGFRKVAAREFSEIYIIDMKGDARTTGEQRRKEGGSVFSDEIRVGVAIYFLVRRETATGEKCQIFYTCVDDYLNAEDKKSFLQDRKFNELGFHHVQPDKQQNWINIANNDWDDLIPIANKETKSAKS